MTAAPDAATIPLTVIGGFLGAGKTTFLNQVLSRAEARYAVLVNDFGAVNVDASLIARHDGETLELSNGCVCCSIGGGLIETLIRVIDAKPAFDRILIEASGVADPWLIAEIALVEPSLRLDTVIVLAEAQRLPELLGDPRVGDTLAAQVRAADILVFNKADLADEAALARAHAAAAAIRPKLRMVETVNAELPSSLLDFGTDFGTRERVLHTGRFRADAGLHESVFSRFLYRREGSFARARLEEALEALPNCLLRLKGLCRMIGEPRPMLVQMVGSRWSISPAPPQAEARWPIELVGIGTQALPGEGGLDRILDAALEPPASVAAAGEEC